MVVLQRFGKRNMLFALHKFRIPAVWEGKHCSLLFQCEVQDACCLVAQY